MTQVENQPLRAAEPRFSATRLGRLQLQVALYEQRYEASTEEMRGIVREDPGRDTAETRKWLSVAALLDELGCGYKLADLPLSGLPHGIVVAQTKRPKKPTKVSDIPVTPAGVWRARLQRQIRRYEQRYEMSTQAMWQILDDDPMRETYDICKWMMARAMLNHFDEPANGTAGSPSTDTSPATKALSNGIPSSSKT